MAAESTSLETSLVDVAPPLLPTFRSVRYDGDDVCVTLQDLTTEDREIVLRLYDAIRDLEQVATAATRDGRAAVDRWCAAHPPAALAKLARSLGESAGITSDKAGGRLTPALHDVRGDVLGALLTRLQHLERRRDRYVEWRTLGVLSRDQGKIMRSALVGLDDELRRLDRERRTHDLETIVGNWSEVLTHRRVGSRSVRLSVDRRYEGPIAECCLERVALDRTFYTLTDHACVRAVAGSVELTIFRPVPSDANLRFTLSHHVSEIEERRLRRDRAVSPSDHSFDLSQWFAPSATHSATDAGLVEVADFARGAFGLLDLESAVRERYVGARLESGRLLSWFHWPVASDAKGPHALD